MKKAIFLIIILTYSCKKEKIIIQNEREYITENNADLKLSGIINNSNLDDIYKLSITKNNIEIIDTQISIEKGDSSVIVSCKKVDCILYSLNDFNNNCKINLWFDNEEIYNFFIEYQFIKKISNTNKEIIFGRTSWPMSRYIKEFDITDISFDEANGNLEFDLFLSINIDESSNYNLNGKITLKVYEKETYH